ncbi:50S ribosomal protein L35 [Candidatus Beckwithbacteria bacterium]|nr:50S ribosomal protein L35 [Candidatus Beckwithbacteria bacterium]
MPKQKTKKSIAKRFKVTKNGKILRRTIGIRHLKSNKTKSNNRRQKAQKFVTGKKAKKIKQILS